MPCPLAPLSPHKSPPRLLTTPPRAYTRGQCPQLAILPHFPTLPARLHTPALAKSCPSPRLQD
ncbi:uncharacterized protein B0I36DRAFT_326894 [Microdochium trichocladiopsis]|uniref:Uncharacterized protein n=1 Tax=Microdochium trichocladiopsis TaxID=1682393 RepID=A0A9P8Y1E2_9PEZI|nr:uncharacterized protein B0I36DRAFT_326894 [Microdochium trichocladiopsis]KAH7027331.1 hypothetical protein B0I36DRAFT_326894 [Microdochium trichocladiopsis]